MAKIEDQHVNVHVNISPDDFENIVNMQHLFERVNETASTARDTLKKLRNELEKINALEKEMEGRKWTIS